MKTSYDDIRRLFKDRRIKLPAGIDPSDLRSFEVKEKPPEEPSAVDRLAAIADPSSEAAKRVRRWRDYDTMCALAEALHAACSMRRRRRP